MNSLQVFNYQNKNIRVMTRDGNPWWVLKDVCDILDIKNPTDVAKRLDDDERARFNLGRQGQAIIINEPGLYNVILRSDKPEAKAFKRWVTHDVLPAIRVTGGYKIPATYSDALRLAADYCEENLTLKSKIEADAPLVLFAKSVEAADTSILVGELAKLIKQNSVDIGQNRLFQWLRDNGYLIRRQGADFNMPTQYSMDLGLFEIKERTVTNPDGSTRITKTPKVTGKGQQYFINKFLAPEPTASLAE